MAEGDNTTNRTAALPLPEAYRLATGQEPPLLNVEQKAQFAEQRRQVREHAREIYGDADPTARVA